MSLAAVALLVLLVADGRAQTVPHRRAILIGINDYSASHVAPSINAHPVPERDLPNLTGAVNDVTAIQEMLVLLYGFDRRDIIILTDQAATRGAILQSVEHHLVDPSGKGDVVLFYYAGHGSQV